MHICCPHCHNAIEVVEKQRPEEVLCPSCGSSFQLEPGTTASLLDRERKIGRFLIIDQVGIGAFGTVYMARDPQLDRVVALKVPRSGNLATQEDLDRFLREARSMAQIRHQGIVPIFEVGHEGGVPYLVSEFVRGTTLADLLSARRPTFRESAELVAAVADALSEVHRQGVVHRDVKPSNIMLQEEAEPPSQSSGPAPSASTQPLRWKPRLMDFGLAKREVGEITMTIDGQVLGTPAYMSPEQAGGSARKVDGRSDVYSLGVILYELLTGELPFRGTARMLIHQVIHDEPRPPRRLHDHIPRDLETICLKGMAKEPARRYHSAAAFADDLRRWLNGEPILARSRSIFERLWQTFRRKPLIAGTYFAIQAKIEKGRADTKAVEAAAFAKLADRMTREAQEERHRADGETETARQERDRANRLAMIAQDERLRTSEASQRAIRNHYVAQMNLAQRDWEEAEIGCLLERLQRTRPENTGGEDLRGFEWYYWHRRCHGELLTFRGHTSRVQSVAFSPDGEHLASASWDGTVRLRNLATGQETLTLSSGSPISSITFSHDGLRLAAGNNNGTVIVWNSETGQEKLRLNFRRDVPIFRVRLGEKNSQFPRPQVTLDADTPPVVRSVAFSPDGRYLASASDRAVRLCSLDLERETMALIGHSHTVNSVAFNPDGRLIASGSIDGTVKLWEVATGQELFTFKGHLRPVSSVAFSPDGQRLASGGFDGTLRVWSSINGVELTVAKGHGAAVQCVAFSPDGTRIASASDDRTVKLWDSVTGQEALTIKGHTAAVASVAFGPDGRTLASGSEDQTVKVWDPATPQEVFSLRNHLHMVMCMAFSPDGTRMASGSFDRTVKVWDLLTSQETFELRGHTRSINCVAFNPDGTFIASGSSDQTVKVWYVATGQETLTLRGHTHPVVSVSFGSDGLSLVSTSDDKTVKVWDLATGQEKLTRKGNAGAVRVALSADGASFVQCEDGGIKVRDVASGRETLTLQGQAVDFQKMAFSVDGALLASGNSDGTVNVWDAETGRVTHTLKGHARAVGSVAFSPDGTRLASASEDGTIKIWDVVTGQETLTLRINGDGAVCLSVVFSPDGRQLASSGGGGTVWDTRPKHGAIS